MEWLRKISAAIDYIETNLDKDLSYLMRKQPVLRVVHHIIFSVFFRIFLGLRYLSMCAVVK